MKRFLLILSIHLCLSVPLKAQLNLESRIEIEVKDGFRDGDIFKFGEHGVIMTSSKPTGLNKKEWRFDKYNSEIEHLETVNIELSGKLILKKTVMNGGRLHLYFEDRKYGKTRNTNFSFVSIEVSTMKVTTVEGVLPNKVGLSLESILGDMAYFMVYKKRHTYLYTINLKTGVKVMTPLLIDNVSPNRVYPKDLQVLDDWNEVLVYVGAYMGKENPDTYIIRLNEAGVIQDSFNLTKNVSEIIVDISALKLGEDNYLYTGTYRDTSLIDLRTNGVFICETEKDKIKFIELYNYLDLEKSLSYLSEKERGRLLKQIDKEQQKGGARNLSQYVLPHNIVSLEDGYMFIGESYFATTTTTVEKNVTATPAGERFAGYQYTHAILCKFDKKGKLQWDDTFELQPIHRPFELKNLVAIDKANKNSIDLVYFIDDILYTKSVGLNGAVLKEVTSQKAQSTFDADRLKESFLKIKYWYDDYFIVYGYQEIKNSDDKKKTKRKRRIFFINKVEFKNN